MRTPAQIMHALELLAAGATGRAAADAAGLTRQTVQRLFERRERYRDGVDDVERFEELHARWRFRMNDARGFTGKERKHAAQRCPGCGSMITVTPCVACNIKEARREGTLLEAPEDLTRHKGDPTPEEIEARKPLQYEPPNKYGTPPPGIRFYPATIFNGE